MDRHDFVREFFKEQFEYGPDFEPEDVPDAAWDRQADTLHAPFGFQPAQLVDDRWVMTFSADVIVAQTQELSEGELDTYLHALQLHLDQHVTHLDMAPDELERQIDHVIYGLSPAVMELVNRVQMASLGRTPC